MSSVTSSFCRRQTHRPGHLRGLTSFSGYWVSFTQMARYHFLSVCF